MILWKTRCRIIPRALNVLPQKLNFQTLILECSPDFFFSSYSFLTGRSNKTVTFEWPPDPNAKMRERDGLSSRNPRKETYQNLTFFDEVGKWKYRKQELVCRPVIGKISINIQQANEKESKLLWNLILSGYFFSIWKHPKNIYHVVTVVVPHKSANFHGC